MYVDHVQRRSLQPLLPIPNLLNNFPLILLLLFYVLSGIFWRIMDTHGDDLDDDFVPDDLVAMSEDEDHSADGEDVGDFLSGDEGGAGEAGPSQISQAAMDKKRKRRQKEKERKAKVRHMSVGKFTVHDLNNFHMTENEVGSVCGTC